MNEEKKVEIEAPSYYTWHPSGVECKTIIAEFPMCIGSAMKYLWRAGRKAYAGKSAEQSAVIDCKKAIQWLETEIKRLEDHEKD